MRKAIAWYLAWSMLALAAVAAGAVVLSVSLARTEALRDAEKTARAVADAIVSPLANEGLHSGDSVALATLTTSLDARVLDGSIVHLKLWEDAGEGRATIVWADEKPLVDQTFAMESEVYALFGTTGTVSEISHLEKEENALERSAGQLVEVYTGVIDSAGRNLVFESYVSTEGLEDETRMLVGTFLPLSLGAVLVFALATLPLAVSLARRVDRGQQQMRRLLVNAVAASDLERKRLARNLHDGVIQDLAGIGYVLAAESQQRANGPDLSSVEEVRSIVVRDIATLRDLLMDIYPPDVDEEGLPTALSHLVERLVANGAPVALDVDPDLTTRPVASRLAYQLIRELLRNSVLHSGATRITVRVRSREGFLEFDVQDDGVGFEPGTDSPEGHLGLRLVREMAADAGGWVTVTSAPGRGTIVSGAVPG